MYFCELVDVVNDVFVVEYVYFVLDLIVDFEFVVVSVDGVFGFGFFVGFL